MQVALPRLIVALVLIASSASAAAGTRLLALSARGQVTLDLQRNGTALVSEQRRITLAAGGNQIDFSWTNSNIDADSLLLRVLPTTATTSRPGVQVVAVSYPAGGHTVSWNVHADHAESVRLRISYLLAGLPHQFHYRAVTGADWHRLALAQYLRIDNQTPDSFVRARLVSALAPALVRGVPRDASVDFPVVRYPQASATRLYRAGPATGYLDRSRGELNVEQRLVLVNDKRHGLGPGALAAGKVRIFHTDTDGNSAFLGEDRAATTAPGERLVLTLGRARDIVVRRQVVQQHRQRIVGNLYRYSASIRYQIDNHGTRPARLELIEHPRQIRDQLFGHKSRAPQWRVGAATTLPQPPNAALTDQRQLVFDLDVPAEAASGKRQIYTLQLDFANEW